MSKNTLDIFGQQFNPGDDVLVCVQGTGGVARLESGKLVNISNKWLEVEYRNRIGDTTVVAVKNSPKRILKMTPDLEVAKAMGVLDGTSKVR